MKRSKFMTAAATVLAAAMLMTACGASTSTQATSAAADEDETEAADEAAGDDAEAAGEGTALDTAELQSRMAFPVGDLSQIEMTAQANEMTADEEAEMDRAMRAYVPAADSLLINKAESFYYYDQLDEDTQGLYDAIYMAVEDAENAESIVTYLTDEDPYTDEFILKLYTAEYALLYDHAELFWLYNDIDTSLGAYVGNEQVSGMNVIYLKLEQPVEDYVAKQTAFNEAVDAFLADIDMTQSDADIALQIHDKIDDMVTYDMAVLEKNSGDDYAHTAYGVLVENSEGQANTAVCDGYSQAYTYLLQQCGIESTVVLGSAGSDLDNLGGHAWSIVNLDGSWHEVDSTWDDVGTTEEQLTEDISGYEYLKEGLEDPDYRQRLSHYLYSVSTETISEYVMTEDDIYYSKDGQVYFSLIGDSYHVRDTDQVYGAIMAMAPIAE